MNINIKAIGISEKGRRENQEDYIKPAICENASEEECFVVCDGMGGHENGEVASRIVGEMVYNYIKEQLAHKNSSYDKSDVKKIISDSIWKSIRALNSEVDGKPSKMGTTLALLLFTPQGYCAGHIGDSRIYHYRPSLFSKEKPFRGVIYKSWDHSLVNVMIESGVITEKEARNHPKKNVITRAIMPYLDENKPDCELFFSDDIRKGDYFLVCSDGVCGAIEDEELYSIIASAETLENKAEKIARLCERLSDDNYSFWLIEVE